VTAPTEARIVALEEDALRVRAIMPTGAYPDVVCLCGSTRFGEAYREANLRETLAGKIVLTIGCDMRSDADLFADMPAEEVARVKAQLDNLHLRKIEMADEILVLNVGGYVGESTAREIAFAELLDMPIRWLEEPIAAQASQ